MNNVEVSIHPSSYIDNPSSIGAGTRIWHFCHVMEGSTIGTNCTLGQNTCLGDGCVIGNNVKIQNNVTIFSGVELEDYVFCGPSMVFTNIKLPRSEFPQRGSEFHSKTLVKKSASIGANATIVCGITIGEFALIGSGAVVTKDVPAHALIVGNPGKVVGWVDEKGHRLEFDKDGLSTCKIFRFENTFLLKIK